MGGGTSFLQSILLIKLQVVGLFLSFLLGTEHLIELFKDGEGIKETDIEELSNILNR